MSSWIGFLTGLVVSTLVIMTFLRTTDPGLPAAPVTAAAAEAAGTMPVPHDAPSQDNARSQDTATDAGAGIDADHDTQTGGSISTVHAAPDTPAGGDAPPVAPVAREDALPEFRWDRPPDVARRAAAQEADPEESAWPPAPASPATETLPPPDSSPGVAPAAATTADGTLASRNWHAFWTPFTSELSATGFSQRLERVTGLDYRVVRVTAGEYHVAFAYDDDAQRLTGLAAIEQATGFALQDGLQ